MKPLLSLVILLLNLKNAPKDIVSNRFDVPHGYHLTFTDSFGAWLGQLPLKPYGAQTRNYRGEVARTNAYTAAVIDMSVGKRDLQQCADAVIRLRAEYLYARKQYHQISFNFTSGFKCDYAHYASGYRYRNNQWIKTTFKDYSYQTFLDYLTLVFSYAGTISLEKELFPVNDAKDLKAGDVFIHGGSPGHCFIVLAVAENSSHEQKFLLAQSFMPAQDIQVLQTHDNKGWFSLSEPANIPYGELVDAKYLRRFRD